MMLYDTLAYTNTWSFYINPNFEQLWSYRVISGWWFEPLWKNMKVSWDYYSHMLWQNKIHVPNHQPDMMVKLFSIHVYEYKTKLRTLEVSITFSAAAMATTTFLGHRNTCQEKHTETQTYNVFLSPVLCICFSIHIHTHTITHTNIYIYICRYI